MSTSEAWPISELLLTGCTLKIVKFSKLRNERKYYSNVFVIGGCKWMLVAFPCRWDWQYVSSGHLGLYLRIADSPTQHGQWSVDAEFSLALVDQKSNASSQKNMVHSFTAQGDQCGLANFISLDTLRSPEKGYIVNDTCVVEVGITVLKVVGYMTYPVDSKKETTGGQGVPAAPTKFVSDGCQSTDEKKIAYHAVLRYLYEVGEHSWKKEALLTELREALGISSSDHNMYLKRVLCGGLPNLNLLGQ